MRKLIWLLILLLLLAACAQNEGKKTAEPGEITETVTLYYGDAQNEKLVSEERELLFAKRKIAIRLF